MTGTRSAAVALAFVASASLVSHAASAESGAALVAIVTSEPNASLTRRVSAELQGLGLDVIVLKPPAEASPLRGPLEQAARNVGAVAAVRLVPSGAGKVEIWVVDRVTGKTVVRDLDASETGASEASVAVGTVELLRASLMELHSDEPSHGEVHATPKLEALALPSTGAKLPRLALGVSGGAELGLRGLGPSAVARLSLWVRIVGRLGVRAMGDATLAPAQVTAPEGSAEVRSEMFGAALVYDFVDPSRAWVPEVSLGFAGSHVTTTGTAVPPYVGASADAWCAAPFVGFGLGWAFVRGIRIRVDNVTAWAFPTPRVRTPTGEVGLWGAPAETLTLGIEVLWSP